LNYRHGFHAGNFADVVKHAILTRALVALTRKDAPFRYIDTHAGTGRYDLSGEQARRSPEWRDGIARLLGAPPPPSYVEQLLRPYLDAVGSVAADHRPISYPGSPAIAQRLARANDVIALNEKHPDERRALESAIGKDRRIRFGALDGYVALGAQTPPKERRGLALIDPPFEEPQEHMRIAAALRTALGKWPQGCYVVWRPIKDRQEDAAFLDSLKELGRANVANVEHDVGRVPARAATLRRAGLVIINPPYRVFEEIQALLTYLTPLLARGDGASFKCEWLAPPT